jgi:alkanesulfonate monooxygenase SsuD/methylene tetrahydromethanopterin reductase-like flavin-dependent oxidoreductase (luciferase family)
MAEMRGHVAQVRVINPTAPCFRLIEVSCAATESDAVRRAAPYLLEKYAAYASWGVEGLTPDPGAAPEDQFRALARDRFVVGDPAAVSDGLVALWEAGISHVTMRVSWPGMPQAEILRGIERLGSDVLPQVRRRTS